MNYTNGGVTAAKGFRAAGMHCGIRANKTKRDLALVVSDVKAACACVYTSNLVKGAPLTVTKNNISDGYARAIICNSGNANTCNADGIEVAEKMCALVGDTLALDAKDVVVASTGVIGQPLDVTPIANALPTLAGQLGYDLADGANAAEAIMTTDTTRKEVAVTFEIGGVKCTMGGMAKGSGMIHPNLATMLVFITTDAALSPEMLDKALKKDVTDTFNMVSVDGDTSTNDMVCLMANGAAGAPEVSAEGEDFDSFCAALRAVTMKLCREIAGVGEGATKLMECKVSGAKDKETARIVAKSIICSSLTKAAMFGADANWGRVLCAIGYSGADVSIGSTAVSFVSAAGKVDVCRNGAGIPFSEEIAKKVLTEKEITILVSFADGEGEATAWGCDLTYDYVKINGDYRT